MRNKEHTTAHAWEKRTGQFRLAPHSNMNLPSLQIITWRGTAAGYLIIDRKCLLQPSQRSLRYKFAQALLKRQHNIHKAVP